MEALKREAMEAMNALVVSLNFTPGHFSHLVANYRLLEECGYLPHLYIHPRFNGMDEGGTLRKLNSPVELKGFARFKQAVFWFPSLKNITEMFRLRVFYRTRLTYVFHEPFDSFRNYHRAGFGLFKIAKIVLINIVNVPILLMAHHVILPSSASYRLYRRYRWLNGNCSLIPLLFDDEANGERIVADAKDCVSYIGTVAADHAFDCFVNFVDAAVGKGLVPGMKFLIATRSEIPPRERDILERLTASGRVEIQSGRPLSTSEINGYFKRSAVVWNAYHRTNQSGILPKAFMFGAAVVSLARNSNEYVDDRVTGVLIEDNSNVSEIAAAVAEICTDNGRYAAACRSKFLSTFYYRSKVPEFVDLLGHQNPQVIES